MANRNLLIDIGEDVRFEAAFLPANCTITGSGKILARTSGVGTQSACRAGLPRKHGKLTFSAKITNTTTPTCAIGVGTTFATNAVNLGTDLVGDTWAIWSGQSASGQWSTVHNNVGSGSLGAVASGDYFVVVFDIQNGNLWLGMYPNGSPGSLVWAGGGDPSANSSPTYSGLNGAATKLNNVVRSYYIMASAFAVSDSIQLLTKRSEQTAFNVNFTPWGEWAFVAADAIATSPTDSQWQRFYDGRIGVDSDPQYQRSVSFWTFGNRGQPQQPISNIDILNGDGNLDWMLGYDLKDITITGWIYTKPVNGQAMLVPDSSTWTKAFSVIGDHLETPNENVMRLVIGDSLSRLQTPAQQNTYAASAPNASIVGQLMPLCFGFNQFIPLVMYDAANLEFDLEDMPQGPTNAFYDQGVALSLGTGFQFSRSAAVHGFTRVTNPAGRQCVQTNGQMVYTLQALSEPWGAWAAGAPGGMIVTLGANCTLTNPSGTLAQFNCTLNQANHTSTLQCAYIPPSISVWIEIICSAFTSGYVEVVGLPTSNVVNTAATAVLAKIDRVGTYRIAISGDNVHRAIGIQWGKVICNLQISGANIFTGGTTDNIREWVTELCVNRAGFTTSEIDFAGTLATLAGVGYTQCYYQQQQNQTVGAILQGALDAHTAGMWQDRNKILKFGRQLEPSGLTQVAQFDDRTVVGDIVIVDDFAQGLSGRMAGVKNACVHSTGDIAGSIINTALATQLQALYLTIATGVGVLDPFYAEALTRDPQVGSFSIGTHVQTEATRVVGTLYPKRRRLFIFSAICTDAQSYTIEPCDGVLLTIGNGYNVTVVGIGRSRYKFAGNAFPLQVISATSRFLSDVVNFICWG